MGRFRTTPIAGSRGSRRRAVAVVIAVAVSASLSMAPALAAEPNPDLSQNFPSELAWTVEVSARPVANPVSSGDRLFLALQSGISARRLQDGQEIWNVAIEVDGPMTATAERLIVPSKGALRALDAATGKAVWTTDTGPLTAPPLLYEEVLYVASADRLTAYQIADGASFWTAEVGRIEERPAVHDSRLYVSLADGPVLALDRASGKELWSYDMGIKPTEPIVHGDRVLVGSAAKVFCSLFVSGGARTRRDDWCFQVGASVFGRAAADASRIYFVAFDNQLYALNKDGSLRWKKDLKYRPSAGPTLVGSTVSAPGRASALQAFDGVTGKEGARLTLPDELVAVPIFIAARESEPIKLAALAGGLQNVWRLTLAVPPVPQFPPHPVAPLTVLPGLAVPLGALPVPPG